MPCRGPRAGTRDRPRAPAVAGPYLGQRLGRSPHGLGCRSGDGVVFPSGLELPPCRHPALPALPRGLRGPPWVGASASPEPARADARGDPPRRLGAPPSAFPVSPMHATPPCAPSPVHAGAHPAPSTPTEMGGPATSSMEMRPRANPTIRCKVGWGGKGSSPSPWGCHRPGVRGASPSRGPAGGWCCPVPPNWVQGWGGGRGGGPAQPPG